MEFGGVAHILQVPRDANAYDAALNFCQDNELPQKYIKKLAMLILNRMQGLSEAERDE